MLRRCALAALVGGLFTVPGRAQNDTAKAFLESIYRPYLATNYPGQPYQEADRFFVPRLAAAMKADGAAAARRGEVPLLNGDPFLDAQDWEIAKLAITVTPKTATTATGTVTFVNHGEARKLLIELEQTSAGWRIADISGPSGSLSALYRKR